MLGFQALRYTVVELWRPQLWLWALPLAACEVATVATLWNAAHPSVSWFMAPLLLAIGGADTLHYPRIFELLPALYARADVLIGATVGAVAIGAGTIAFAERFRGEPVHARAALAAAARRAPALVLVQLPFNAAVFLLDQGLGRWLASHGGGLVSRLGPFLLTGSLLAVQALFFYTVALVALERMPVLAAFRALPSTWRRGFLPAFVVGVVTLLALLPLHPPGVRLDLLIHNGRPELAGWFTLLQTFSGLLNAFILTGCATLLYLSAVRVHAEDS